MKQAAKPPETLKPLEPLEPLEPLKPLELLKLLEHLELASRTHPFSTLAAIFRQHLYRQDRL